MLYTIAQRAIDNPDDTVSFRVWCYAWCDAPAWHYGTMTGPMGSSVGPEYLLDSGLVTLPRMPLTNNLRQSLENARHNRRSVSRVEIRVNGETAYTMTADDVTAFLTSPPFGSYTVEIGTWTDGTPVTVLSFPVESREAGHAALWRLGHSRDYDCHHAGYLKDHDGNTVLILDIYPGDRWGIRDRQGER